MDVGHHGGDPAHVEILAARAVRALQAAVDVALHALGPVALVRHVDGELLGVRRDRDLRMRHQPLPVVRQGEARHALTRRQHQHGLTAIEAIEGRDLLAAGLQEVGLGRRGRRRLQHRDDGADRGVDVDVGRAVQRVEQDQVFARRVRRRLDRVHFFRRHARHARAGQQHVRQDVVGDDVELLLLLVLHVDDARCAQRPDQGPARNDLADLDAGGGGDRQGLGQALRQIEGSQVGGEVGAGGHGGLQSCHESSSRPSWPVGSYTASPVPLDFGPESGP
ncbi:hypothetical protein D3C80_1253110 [compost metagenome]